MTRHRRAQAYRVYEYIPYVVDMDITVGPRPVSWWTFYRWPVYMAVWALVLFVSLIWLARVCTA